MVRRALKANGEHVSGKERTGHRQTMNFQEVVDGIDAMACVISVERLPDDRYGKMCIVSGNRAYINSIETVQDGVEMLDKKFVPGSEYTRYTPKDLNFEDFCYQAAVKKKCLHSYVHPDRYPVWFNLMFLPLQPDEGNLSFCVYIMEISAVSDSDKMSDVSSDTAASVLKTCIQLRGTKDFKSTMNNIIKDIRVLCKAEQCCILLMDPLERTCSVLCEDFEEGSKLFRMETFLDDGFYDIAESWEDTIAGSNCIIAKNEADMLVVKDRNPAWYASLSGASVKSIVLFPLKSGEQLLGYIWAVNFEADDTSKIKETLELTTFILGSEIANFMLLDRLRVLSSRDMLTGVNNRNEMNRYVDELCNGEKDEDTTVGVIFTDLNGLKDVNDSKGHIAGDQLLKDAASVLKSVFDEICIFRAGGDEFTIMIEGITEEELDRKIIEFRNAADEKGIYFAVGSSLVQKPTDVRKALREADGRMYEDKARFYREHPDKVRKTHRDKFRSEHNA